jgi:hypothetical protein
MATKAKTKAKTAAKKPAAKPASEGGSIISRDRAQNYVKHDVKTASGRRAVDCNDAVSARLRGKTPEQVEAIAEKAGLDLGRWSHLNAGMKRMAIGNALRAQERAKEKAKAEREARKAAKTAAQPSA